jgi:hypothetical protein
MIASLLVDYLPDRHTLVTSVQNKAVDALVGKLQAVGHRSFLVAGARNPDQQRRLEMRVAPLTGRYTAWARASRWGSVKPLAVAKAVTRLLRPLTQELLKQSKREYQRNMRNASETRRTLECMGMLDPEQDSWRRTIVISRWLKLDMLRRQETMRVTNWHALSDALLHRHAVMGKGEELSVISK